MEQLLKILEDNARLPIEDIATMLNKSPAEVAAMIDLARAQGIIKGYKTLVDWEKAGVNRVEAVFELNAAGDQGPDLPGDRPVRGKAPFSAGRCAVHRHPFCAAHL